LNQASRYAGLFWFKSKIKTPKTLHPVNLSYFTVFLQYFEKISKISHEKSLLYIKFELK